MGTAQIVLNYFHVVAWPLVASSGSWCYAVLGSPLRSFQQSFSTATPISRSGRGHKLAIAKRKRN